MIDLKVKWDGSDICAFDLRGHAHFAEEGEDIVCAGVSALVYTAVNSCEILLGSAPLVVDGEVFQCTIPDQPSTQKVHDGVQLLMKSMRIGILQIADQYPSHVRVTDVR